MKRLLAIFILAATPALGQYTPAQLASIAASYNGLSDSELTASRSGLLSLIAFGAVLSPSNLVTNSTPYTGLSDRQLAQAEVGLLNNISSGAINGVLTTNVGNSLSAAAILGPVLYVATNGNDANSGYSISAPKATPYNAVQAATNGVVVYCMPGRWELGTNQLVLGTNVSLFGAGMFLTEFSGYADCAGVEDALAPTGGPQIVPNDNSQLRGFTVTCNTNAIYTNFSAVGGPFVTGTWSGVGFSSANPPSNLAHTNVSAYDVRIRLGYFDCFHFNSSNRMSFYAERCVAETQGNGVNNQIGSVASISYETAANLSSVFTFNTCWFTNDPTDAINTAMGTGNTPSVASTDRRINLINCFGYGTNYWSPSSSAYGPFTVLSVPTASQTNPQPSIIVSGGSYAGVTNWPSSYVHGFATFSGVAFYNGVLGNINAQAFPLITNVPNSNTFYALFNGNGAKTNFMIQQVTSGVLSGYWSDGTNVYNKQLLP